MRNKKIGFLILVVLIVVFALFLRFAFLGERVLHHDEGVNYFFADKIIRGEGFAYDPLNYHGPFYFFILALSFFVFGINEFGLRFPAAIFGISIVLAPLFFKIGEWKERAIGCVFLLLSPSLIYYSRYSIHESAFVFFSLMSIYFFSLILEKKNLEYLPWLGASLGALLVSKETAVIMLFILFVIGIVNFKRIRKISFKGRGKIVLFSVFIFALIYAVFFTSFFSNNNGIGDSIRGFMPWVERGLNEKGHDKAFYYYFLLLGEYEWPLLLFALIGIYCIIRDFRKENNGGIFNLNLALWSVFIFLIYSLIPYKTPWLVINLSVPLSLVAGIGAFHLRWRRIKWILLGIGILYLGYMAIYLNFVNFEGEGNKFAYVHTDKDILNLVGKINENYKEGDRILIASAKYWPLPFYLHGKSVSYLDSEEFYDYTDYEDYDFFIFREGVFERVGLLEGQGSKEYRLHSGERLVLVWGKQ